MEWLGHAKIVFTHAPSTLKIKKKDGESTDLQAICRESTPPCHLNPLLFNGHFQTMWTAVIKTDGPPLHYKRKIFEAEDPDFEGTFAVDFVSEPFSESDDTLPIRTTYFKDEEFAEIGSLDTRPMLVALNGLTGGSDSVYCKLVLAPLVGAYGEGKWEACVVTSRGCAMSKITSSALFNARATWDCANVLINYIGEEGSACELKAAVVCSNPWNLDVSHALLKRTWIGKEVYSRALGSSLRKVFTLNQEKMSKNPYINLENVRQAKYLPEFDREVQGPTWGYPTEGAYYRDSSCIDALLAAKIPIFAINASDDPIAFDEGLPYQEVQQTPYGVLCTTSMGGHLAWFEWPGGSRWHARPAFNFLKKMAFEVDLTSLDPSEKNGALETNSAHARFEPMRRRWQVQKPS